ncbi:MAG: 30S ribosomal protein S2 [Candidatus Nanohaloarchaea archaeon]
MSEEKEEDLLVDREEYLANGVHIGTKAQHDSMEKYIFHVKKNQLAILNLEDTDQRIRKAAKFLAKYDPEEILVVGRKEAARKPINKFSEATGAETITGRFMPGTLTNPKSENFVEPEVVLVTDPEEDKQAIDEAVDTHIPVVGIVDSESNIENIDLAVPANNKAGNSIGMVYYLLAREILKQKEEELTIELDEFQPETEEKEEPEE